jgi:hypothetical protein
VRLELVATGKYSGSDTICAPTGMSIAVRPSKVTDREVPGSIALTPAAPPAGRATEMLVIGRSLPP